MSTEEQPEQQGIERRTIVKGAAWSLPVIAMAVAAPGASASTQPCVPSLDVTAAGYIRDDPDGWYGEIQSNATGERLGIGGILPGSRMKANIVLRNPTACTFTGMVRLQIDLPPRALKADPVSEQGYALSNGGSYTLNGETWRRYYFTGQVAVGPNSTYMVGINWTLADLDTIRTYFGAPEGPQRWTVLPATQGSMGWRFPNPGGTVLIDGQSKWTTGYNNTFPRNAGWWIHSNTVAQPS
ncbi:hypothetical protein [Microbacterium sp. SLBN-111]|uniref:hypothetical protein n=1 Tax=Microbacterium sp. SLBN-111 TaxID=3377733 RepID=UPI003C73AF80